MLCKGMEAALIVGIIAGYLRQTGRASLAALSGVTIPAEDPADLRGKPGLGRPGVHLPGARATVLENAPATG